MCNERDTVRVALEALLLLFYAWNSCPVPRSDISRSLVAVGREFTFPIDFSSRKHWQLTSSLATMDSYSRQLAQRLSACCNIAELLVCEHRKWHRALINPRRQDPRVYSPGDIVFARPATRLDVSRERVGKLEYKFTRPWRIVASLHSKSYSLEHCLHPKQTEKKHASDLEEIRPWAYWYAHRVSLDQTGGVLTRHKSETSDSCLVMRTYPQPPEFCLLMFPDTSTVALGNNRQP